MGAVEQAEGIAQEAWEKTGDTRGIAVESERNKLLNNELVADLRVQRAEMVVFADHLRESMRQESGYLSQTKHPDSRLEDARRALRKISKRVNREKYGTTFITVSLSGRDILAIREMLVKPNGSNVTSDRFIESAQNRKVISDLENKYLRNSQKRVPHNEGFFSRLTAGIKKMGVRGSRDGRG